MPGDKMIILAEGRNPIFADKLRFFRTAPFRAMEMFSRANLPDVPATEFLPQRAVPATTLRYGGGRSEGQQGHKQEPKDVLRHPAGSSSTITMPPGSVPSTRTSGHRRVTAPRLPPAAANPSVDAIEARFGPAAERLKVLVRARAKDAASSKQGIDWSRIFEETVPDEMEIAGTGGG